jgi:hypothetical protein
LFFLNNKVLNFRVIYHARYGADEELGALLVPLPAAAAAAAASRFFLFNTNS